jgi:predicted ribosomally synthesized peptide with SipW-like signal peptide
MLLAALGVIAVALGGGSGTFASFNAEVANTGNTFATGTLILNDNGGTNTCTSAVNSGNSNTAGTDCDTLFNVSTFTAPSATTTGAITGGTTTSIAVGTISNGAVYAGDKIQISDGTNNDTVTVAATTSSSPITVTVAPTDSFAIGATVTDLSPTYLAKLTLTNAGSIDASGISFKLANGTSCTASYSEGDATLNPSPSPVTAGVATSSIPYTTLTGTFASGDPVVVHEGSHYETFIATGAPTGTDIPVQSQAWNYAYTTSATVSGPELNGAGTPQNLCSSLKLSITETDSSMSSVFGNSSGCAFGGVSTPAATDACDLSGGTALSGLTSSLTPLQLVSGAGSNNSGTKLSKGGSRYFVLAIHYTGTAFDNSYQNTKTTSLDLLWHIDQA